MLLSADVELATIYSITGEMQVISDKHGNITEGFKGKRIYTNDIIRTKKGSYCKIVFEDKNTLVIVDDHTEVKFSENNLSRSFTINYGSMYIKNIADDTKRTMLFTDASQNKLVSCDLWVNIIGSSGDEVYVLNGTSSTYNYKTKKRISVDAGNVIYSYSDGFFDSMNYN